MKKPISLLFLLLALAGLFPTRAPADDLARGLVGWWRFDGNLIDASGNGNNGTVGAGSAAYAAGKYGQSFNFTGANSVKVPSIPAIFTLSTPFSVSFWTKESTVSANINWQSTNTGNGRGLSIGAGVFRLADGTNRKQVDTSDWGNGNWNHITAVYDGSNSSAGMKIYVNGVDTNATSTSNQTLSGIDHAGDLWIGSRLGIAAFMMGQIDNVMIFNRALPPSEIKTLHALGSPIGLAP